MRRTTLFLCLLSALSAGCTLPDSSEPPTIPPPEQEDRPVGYPRLGAHVINSMGTLYQDDDWLEKVGRYSDLTIMNFYLGVKTSTISTVVAKLRDHNPDTRIGAYNNIDEIAIDEQLRENCKKDVDHPLCQLHAALDSGTIRQCGLGYTWWATNPEGDCISDWPNKCNVNITDAAEPQLRAVPGGQGETRQYFGYADYYADVFIENVFRHADFDLWYTDIFQPSVREHKGKLDSYADLDCDGAPDHPAGIFTDDKGVLQTEGPAVEERAKVIGAAKRRAMARFVETVRARYPEVAFMGNSASWLMPPQFNKGTEPVYPEYDQLLDGGHVESVIGPKWAYSGTGADGERVNSYGSFEAALATYRFQLRYARGEEVQVQPVVYDTGYLPEGLPSKEATPELTKENPNKWRTLRYGLGLTLLDNGYFTPNVSQLEGEFNKRDIPIMDEYTRGLPWTCSASTKWLGQPASGPLGVPPTQAFAKGVWVREFQHGLIVVNPHISRHADGTRQVNDAQIIELPAGNWTRMDGAQDPSHNNGEPIKANGQLEIQAGDAYLLARVGSPLPCE